MNYNLSKWESKRGYASRLMQLEKNKNKRGVIQ